MDSGDSGTGVKSALLFVVDDNDDSCRLAAMLLGAYGWEIRTFCDAASCLAAALQRLPACILTDLHMPLMDGTQLIEALRAAGLQVPVIVLTAAPVHSAAVLRAAAIAASLLSKPYEAEQLHEAVVRVIATAQTAPALDAPVAGNLA